MESGATVASAFPLQAFGIGSFDGLYVKPGVTYQLFNGTSTSSPLTPEQVGPMFATPAIWQSLACNGFEPGTVFVPGGAGALANISLRIGGAVDLLEVVQLDDESAADQRTGVYEADDVRRRGSSFLLDVRTNAFFSQSCHEIPCVLTYQTGSGPQDIEIPYKDGSTPIGDEWASEFLSETALAGQEKRIRVRVSIPSYAPIGRGQFTVKVRQIGGADIDDEETFPDPFVVVFNPWSPADTVAMADETSRLAYVLSERGRIGAGEHNDQSPYVWRYDQFDKDGVVLNTACDVLDGLSLTDRASPATVASALTQFVNAGSCGSPASGLLVGCWTGNYTGGIEPSSWSGSLPIYRGFANGGPVSYGQCWVYAGVLTSALRTLGVPARPVTNFRSGTDSNQNGVIDRIYNLLGQAQSGTEGIWNFHVWCEAWLGGGWNVYDGTYEIGPAAVSSVFVASPSTPGVVGFVRAEVDADVVTSVQAFGTTLLSSSDTTDVGRLQQAQSLSPLTLTPVTGSYKASADGAHIEVVAGTLIEAEDPLRVSLGDDIEFEVTFFGNPNAATAIGVNTLTVARSYRGDEPDLATVHSSTGTVVNVPAGAVVTHSFVVPAAAYTPSVPLADSFETRLVFSEAVVMDVAVVARRVVIDVPAPTITDGNVEPLVIGELRNLTVEITNVTGQVLTNGTMLVRGAGDVLIDSGEVSITNLGTVAVGQTASFVVSIEALDDSIQDIVAQFSCDQFGPSQSTLELLVLADGGLTADVAAVDPATGGDQRLQLDLGPVNGGVAYWVLGSLTGTAPGTFLDGFTVPLLFDEYTAFSLQFANTSVFTNTIGFLDPNGKASPKISVPQLPNLAGFGLLLYHAAIIVTPQTCFATNAVPLMLR